MDQIETFCKPTVEEKRQRIMKEHPDMYEFIMAIRQVFGPVTVRIGEKHEPT